MRITAKVDHFGDAVTQKKYGGMSGIVASEVEVRPTGAPGSDAKGIAEAHTAAARRAAIERETGTRWSRPGPFRALLACQNSGCQSC